MYLKNALILESGPIKDLEVEFDEDEDGNPKPMVIVGKNGSGKSNFISFVTDALMEIAAKEFGDVAPLQEGNFGRQWHRIVGGITTRAGSNFELAILKFVEGNAIQTYMSKGGSLSRTGIASRLEKFPDVDWPEEGNVKNVTVSNVSIEKLFREGCYVSFPSDRGEEAYWSGKLAGSDTSVFEDRFSNKLGKPISVKSALQDLRPWLVDVVLDTTVDAEMTERFGLIIRQSLQLQQTQLWQHAQQILQALQQDPNFQRASQTKVMLANVNTLLRDILRVPNAKLVRVGRHNRSRKLMVVDGERLCLPGLDAFSAGQSTLVGIFCTILRYADELQGSENMQEMKGIVLVDEIDAHLHADLQHETLPRLMKYFPKIQFIVTAHAPLFPLGMEKEYGTDGFNLIELPDGRQITAERFSEFQSSFQYLKETKLFDDHIVKKAAELERPLVLCEGQTDPKYLRTAAELLEFDDICEKVDFDWVGVLVDGQAKYGGDAKLRQAYTTLKNNPSFLKFHTIILFDCDQGDEEFDEGCLHVRVLTQNNDNDRCDRGIENLLPPTVFEEEFFDVTEFKNGANETRKRELNKVRLCDHLCDNKRDPADFEGFRPELERIRACLFPEIEQDLGKNQEDQPA